MQRCVRVSGKNTHVGKKVLDMLSLRLRYVIVPVDRCDTQVKRPDNKVQSRSKPETCAYFFATVVKTFLTTLI